MTVVAFVLLLVISNSSILVIINSDCNQFNALCFSKYEYSATVVDPGFQDDYYVFNAEICFSKTVDASSALNADIVMQSNQSQYTDAVAWNAPNLSVRGIAISNNIAKANHLKMGDVLYSKHIVNGIQSEYVVEAIVPEVANARVGKGINHHNGLIIMGYDELYINNLSHNGIVFSTESLDILSSNYSIMPTNLIYRDDEMRDVYLQLIPYVLLMLITSMVLAAMQVLFIIKGIKCNFRRLQVIGTNKHKICKAYFCSVCFSGVLPAVGATLLSFMATLCFAGINHTKTVLLCISLLINVITLLLFSLLRYRQLWRNGL